MILITFFFKFLERYLAFIFPRVVPRIDSSQSSQEQAPL